MPKIDLAQVDIRPFDDSLTVINRFDCGKKPINQFLKNKAKKAGRRMEHRVFCAHRGSSSECIGYYALQLGSDSVSDFPGGDKTYLKNYTAFPAVHMAFVGVHEHYRRQGLGTYLLMDVFSKVAAISDHAGFYALTLQSLDEESTAFYESLNFTIYSEGSKQPKMLYPLEDILTLVRASS
ncbi:GNAT family N-acetyltransferase [Mesorhizobium sp.]|uniref:GNAT family N-acetyltransferase n=1 Tax=Mesorhizobium sp. TaxID=1871066 RepID=UPI000FE46380|nr:GNAT family N-acetyltransferase [Mesorhizobium sp.]RWO96927.1 MAG: GNAT family N-acetyltransferase [Mesorhizobium sp.]